ncbi:glutamine--tRNA ligase/YqeY domain fusion protein [Clostridium sp. 'deep sea']|uniref:glutamine--tRNA ligase/YqeY domain fusion protein n=1 Tax=Clostridium sp. 'deep sea' TaxID=2779445 RepID=UPI0018966BE4|nr:glutamine--tRNA ligase/YqeY domain fusion protein [Clostridium sp. 'deep sea']QOR35481.1 glutamine--tRNA ligase/YqeY domain fusion protein [Clostridium sp. 'deep sea']
MNNNVDNRSYIEKIISKEVKAGKHNKIITRFPPEPNGHLHIGSIFAINISYSMAQKFGGKFNLRFDDTNPLKEDMQYVNSIIEDMNWLGIDYGNKPLFGSDYSQQIYDYALYLISKGKAFVCDLSPDEIREYRGTLTEVGKNSPYRDRTIAENIRLFKAMKNGEFATGEKVLRAKISMSSANINLRDPIIYRIIHESHYRTKDAWCIYPMYDYAHPIQDYIEGVTHSLCSNEFVNNRPLYEWVLTNLDLPNNLPRQIEFGRLNLTGVVTSKRYLRKLVTDKYVNGWDDPRLPTIKGLRRRGIPKEAIFNFLNEIGIPKNQSTVDYKMLEHFARQELKQVSPCVMAVLKPLKVVITNLNNEIELTANNHFANEEMGSRELTFTRELYIERDDFSDNPPAKYKRLVLGGEVRLKNAYFIKCNEIIKDETGKIIELHCTYDPQTKSGSGFTGRKVKGTIQWVSVSNAVKIKARIFNDLFKQEVNTDNIFESLNENSLKEYESAYIEPSITTFINKGISKFQFIRLGFFSYDIELSQDKNITFNRIVALKSAYRKTLK